MNKIVKSNDAHNSHDRWHIAKSIDAHNSHDRWHIAKSVAKTMRTLAHGTKNSCGKTWHPELGDKVAKVKNHIYWAMDNCEGDEKKLQQLLDTSIPHFCHQHEQCDAESPCREPGYIPNYDIVTDSIAIQLLTSSHAQSYIRSRQIMCMVAIHFLLNV